METKSTRRLWRRNNSRPRGGRESGACRAQARPKAKMFAVRSMKSPAEIAGS